MKKTKFKGKAVYTGRRLDGSKVLQRFEERPSGKERWFQGIKGVWIGYTYECGAKQMSRRPARKDDPAINNPAWDAADALVTAHRAEQKAEAKYRGTVSPALKTAVAALKPICKGLDIFEATKLIKYLVDQAWR